MPAATDVNTPSSAVISTPFYQPATFVGTVSSVDSANQVSLTGASFGTLANTLARFKSGNSVGRFFQVTANTATQVTLDTSAAGGSGYTLTTGSPSTTQTQVAVGDSVEILPANTLSTLFGSTSATVPFQQGTSATGADNVLLFNGTSWDTYYFNGSTNHWRKSGNLNNQDNVVVLPDRGIFIVRRATSALPLTFLGAVPSSTEKTDFPGAGSSFRSVRFPVDTTLGTLALQTLPNWTTGTSASGIDNVLIWGGTSWGIYYYNGSTSHWRKSGNLNNQDTLAIPTGTAIFVSRVSSAAGSTSTLTQTLPYSLN